MFASDRPKSCSSPVRISFQYTQSPIAKNKCVYMARFINKLKAVMGMQQTQLLVPPAVPVLLEHRDNFWGCVPARNAKVDTPLRSLYRMYAALVMENNIELRNEFEYFFNHGTKEWSVASLQDPQDPNPERHAILSIIPELLCESFNRLIGMGIPRNRPGLVDREEEAKYMAMPKVFETVPSWCERVPALKTELVLPDRDGQGPNGKDDERADQRFAAKNIVVVNQSLFFT